ncbi:hypothetical protein [Zoogloea dura]|uniref:hypothetical protein n=1 Tax=Zoogloea dura TaxID=2728840 RepID=UPI00145D009A|nr:hypothetical protein [Zoogloea dura]
MILHHSCLRSSCLLVLLLAAGGCASPQGFYSLTAYDGEGKPINPGRSFMAQGRAVYSAINGTCLAYPGARVVVIDKETGREATDLSPHQCRK